MTQDLVRAIQHFVGQSTIELTERVATSLETYSTWDGIYQLPHIPSSHLNALFMDIVQAGHNTGHSPSEVAFSLRTAGAVEERHRETPHLELVLSGPTFPPFEMRRTDEAIVQIIQGARNRLTLVSFALYRVDRLAQALSQAVQRGVEIRLFVESDKLPKGNVSTVYGEMLASCMEVYTWTESRRQHSSGGKGVLHAKVTIADSYELFISSANLTEHAMSLNIELGVLIRGGHYPRKIEQLFDTYLAQGLFEKLHNVT
ncbi:MAG: DISARM system phospholipase D-like protein DrmC [Chloroflexota bacterium]